MDAIEYSVKCASQIASNGSIREAYDQYLTNLGKLVVRLKTNVEMSDNGLLKNGDEALFRMIPLCRVCITKIEDILQAGAMLATMKPSTPQLPSPLAKASARNNSSFFGVDEKPSSGAPEVSLFSAVLDSFPPEFSLKSDAKASPAGVRKSVTLDSYDLRDSKQNSLMRASAEEYANDGERSVQLSIVTNPDGPTSREGSVTKSNEPKLDEVKVEVSKPKSPKSQPEVPTSPLSSTYLSLNQKLISLVNATPTSSSIASPELRDDPDTISQLISQAQSSITGTTGDEEEANSIRTKIAKILHLIQLASVSNPSVNLFCFRPIAIAFQLCLIDHSLLRQIHSNDILNHKPPQSPAPSLQAGSDFFNYLTRLVECSILQQMDIIGRVKVMTKWFKVAVFLKKFNNFQGLKAVTSALNTPPITRLKKTWAHLRKKNANDLTEFEDLCALVSEQSNYSAYRQFIKTNQTRPIVPFLGVILHDVTYLMAVAKKESIDIASDKRIQEIQKFIRYCSLGPRYSYEMLIDLDLAQSTAAGTSNLQKKGIKRKVQGGGLTEQGVETLGAIFKEANEEEIGSFISHWLLTRKWVSEKEVDDMSASREPKVVKAPTVSSYDANSTEDREQIQSRISDDESTMSKTSFEAAQTSSFLRPKEVSALAASPALTRTRTIAGSTSFIEAIKETAYTLVTNKSKQQATQSGTNSPASGSTLNTAKAPAKAGKQLTPEISRGKQLDQLLRRRQKSMTNLEGDDLVGATKSISMDAGINGRPNSAIIQSSESKAGSFDSISGSIGHSTINGLANATTDEPASAYGPGYGAIESEELKRKLEILVNAADALEPRTRRRSSSSTNSAVPKDTPASGAASGNHRHNFFTSFFSYPEEASESESISAKGGKPKSSSDTPHKPDLQTKSMIHTDTSSNSLESKDTSHHSRLFGFGKTTPAQQEVSAVSLTSNASHVDSSKEKNKLRRRASSAGNADSGTSTGVAKDSPQQIEKSGGVVTIEVKPSVSEGPLEQDKRSISSPKREAPTPIAVASTTHAAAPTTLIQVQGALKSLKPTTSRQGSETPEAPVKTPAPLPSAVIPPVATSGVLSWGSKFGKSGTKTPLSGTPVMPLYDSVDEKPKPGLKTPGTPVQELKNTVGVLGKQTSVLDSPRTEAPPEILRATALPSLPKPTINPTLGVRPSTPPAIPQKPLHLSKSKLTQDGSENSSITSLYSNSLHGSSTQIANKPDAGK